MTKFDVSERLACRLLGQHRSTQRKAPKERADDAALTADIVALATQYGRYGYRRITAMLRAAGWAVNAKRVERIWRLDVLSDLFILRGVPGHVRSDNGPEFIAKAVREWIAAVGARTAFIEPGSPWENGYCESFNSKLRDELLNGELFYTLAEARIVIESWRRHYNTQRPHSSFGYKPPAPHALLWPAGPHPATMAAKPTMLDLDRATKWGQATAAGQGRPGHSGSDLWRAAIQKPNGNGGREHCDNSHRIG
jgi:transposase InsO family protein